MNDGVLHKDYAHERLSKKYLQFRYKERALVAATAIKKYFGATVLLRLVDFGAAEGLTLIEIARLCGRGKYIGIEFDQGLIESAPPLPHNIKLIQGDVAHCPMIADNSVDVITALAILEHLECPVNALKEANRILKPGGILIATSPFPFWDALSSKIGTAKKFGGDYHLVDVDEKFFRSLGAGSGLIIEKYFKFMWLPIGLLPYLKFTIDVSLAWKLDQAIESLKIFNWSFINQCVVMRKNTHV